MADVNPYDLYKQTYDKQMAAINQQTENATNEKKLREQQAQKALESANRSTYTSFMNQVNPYGSFASQNNFSSAVSDYYKNASYGTYLTGLGSNQSAYTDSMNNSNVLWQNYLAEKAGNEASALDTYNNAVVAQKKYDKEKEDEERDRQEAIRQYNMSLQLQQEQLARQREADAEARRQWETEQAENRRRWETEQAENKRRYDQEWAYQLSLANSGSSGGSGGGYRRGSGSDTQPTLVDINPNKSYDDQNRTKMSGNVNDKTVDKSKTVTRNGYTYEYNKYGVLVSKKKTKSTTTSKQVTDKKTGKKYTQTFGGPKF